MLPNEVSLLQKPCYRGEDMRRSSVKEYTETIRNEVHPSLIRYSGLEPESSSLLLV